MAPDPSLWLLRTAEEGEGKIRPSLKTVKTLFAFFLA
jgi:hypothetical protein